MSSSLTVHQRDRLMNRTVQQTFGLPENLMKRHFSSARENFVEGGVAQKNLSKVNWRKNRHVAFAASGTQPTREKSSN